MKKNGIRLTSFGLATLMLLGNSITVTRAFAAEDRSNKYSYDISYVNDDSDIVINDAYTESLMDFYKNADDSMVVDIPEFAREAVCKELKKDSDEKITVGELRTITYLFLLYDAAEDENIDMSWLNYCSNLESLEVMGNIVKYFDGVLALDSAKKVSLYTTSLDSTLDLKNCGFIKHCPELEELFISGNCNIEQLYQFENIKHLSIDGKNINSIDYRRLSFLDEITLNGGVYDIAINLSTEDVQYLESNGIKISFGDVDQVTMEDLSRVNEKLDKIVQEMNVSPDASDEEKINAVLVYVLSHLEYDETVHNQLINNQDKYVDHSAFYIDGDLYAALEKDTQICGNYTALTSALLHRLGVDAYSLYSDDHAWNLVEVDGEYYYYDSTWLDSETISTFEAVDNSTTDFEIKSMKSEDAIKSGDSELLEQLTWYKVKPSDYLANPDEYEHDYIGSHSANNFPMNIVEVRNNNENVSNNDVEENATGDVDTQKVDKNFGRKVFDVTIGNKTFRITGAVLIGLMTALGAGFIVKKKKDEKRLRDIRRREQENMFGEYKPFGSYDYFDDDNQWKM